MAPELSNQKRSAESVVDASQDHPEAAASRKTRKVSRACDYCKFRKAKCTGDQPCAKCISRGRICLYEARYTRGMPPTPPPSSDTSHRQAVGGGRASLSESFTTSEATTVISSSDTTPSDLGMAEIQGQVFDPTSSLAFLHRASRRLSAQGDSQGIDDSRSVAENQLMFMAGDKPLASEGDNIRQQPTLPDPEDARTLLTLYFDVCIATYRILHRPSTESWLGIMESNLADGVAVWQTVGRAKAAIIYAILAIAKFHQEKSKGCPTKECQALRLGDQFFRFSMRLADQETGYPRLESAQVRIVQVLYLLTTSRFNQSWYVFGNALQLISALGLQRRADWRRRHKSAADYIEKQCSLRTFWTAYVLDNYLGVVFGRPRHFHDDNIDQDLPDRINDEDMSADGPVGDFDDRRGCHTDALVFHARIAKIIGAISQEMYTENHSSEVERIAAAKDLTQLIRDWHQSLPAHLGAVHPSILIPSYRRPALALGLAHSHAIMHANRLFLMRTPASAYVTQVGDCIRAAKDVLESVDTMARGSPIFHAFWWTHYVTFCALVVTYVWVMQQYRMGTTDDSGYRTKLMQLAESCHGHLARATASNSPSRRYAVILEGFKAAAMAESTSQRSRMHSTAPNEHQEAHSTGTPVMDTDNGAGFTFMFQSSLPTEMPTFLDWQLTDWLDLDSSVSIPIICMTISVVDFLQAFWPSFNLDEAVRSPDGFEIGA
ncbi:N-terminal binuclear Zn cluster-containing/DNA binding domain-containing protein [Trichoderma reesei QM6a]|uniref:N-terminal binuclear Zn cluster-containing/DNA binding domain-containing protein n=1 Tax=Hypocrea jecorina (strain QM6a) TaxID=431241 RepID=G0RXK4_HYPJQ|nr:N-terminal binuclear Zn cluster-containing/DNA binding domain-containing protein [Trichoderma reesei QM6a]EGR44078.1 N-terminal binuclear Zn cluster-containing/DNA binding domain-containing protein [Trichoderma reesei QM6a]